MPTSHPPTETPTLHPLTDFSERLDPMVVKELRQGLQARWFVLPFLLTQAAALLIVWLESLNQIATQPTTEWGFISFWALVYVLMVLVLPLRALFGLNEEMTNDAASMLLMAGLSRWRIVGGKWLTQMMLSGLVLISLLPYAILRYFFGGVEWWPNAMMLMGALGAAAGMNALLLGASGYSNGWTRALIAGSSLGYMLFLLLAHFLVSRSTAIAPGDGIVAYLAALWWLLGDGLHFVFFTLCGLQLARARLRLSLRPWEIPPSSPALILFFPGPLILSAGTFATCFFGFPVTAGLLVWCASSLDRRVRHHPQKTAPPPRLPAPS